MAEEKKVYKAYEIGENEEQSQIIAFLGTRSGNPKLDLKTGIEWCRVDFAEQIRNGKLFESAREIVPCNSLFKTAENAINDYENKLHEGVPEILFRIKYPNYPIDDPIGGGKVRYKLKKKKSLQKGKQRKSKRVKKKKTKKLLRKQTRTRKK